MSIQSPRHPKLPTPVAVPTNTNLYTTLTMTNRDTKGRSGQVIWTRETTSASNPESNMTSNHRLGRYFLLPIATTSTAVVGLWDILQRARMDNLIYRNERLYLQTTIPPDIYESLIPLLSSPAILILGVLITTGSLTTYRYLHRHEKHQAPIMIAFLVAGIVAGKVLGLDNIAVLLRISLWCIILAFLASTVSASYSGKWQEPIILVEVVVHEKV